MNIIRWMTGYRSRSNYWSNSKLSHWLQEKSGMEKSPNAATAREWRLLGERQQEVNRVVYWITEEGFDIVQDFIYFPKDVYRNVYAKLHNIFVSKSHYLVTKLPRGEWHDCDTRILHGLMETVVDFVESEKAHMMRFDEDFDLKNSTPRETGLAHLDWEIALIKDENYVGSKDHPEYGKPTEQALAAQEIKDVYLWWKDVRPNRPDPHDESGWSAYCDNKRHMFENEDETEEQRAQVREILDACQKLEQQYDDEDTEMLIRIIKVRKSMWT